MKRWEIDKDGRRGTEEKEKGLKLGLREREGSEEKH